MNKKKMFLVAIAVCLISVISLGTLAWFSASDSVSNKFMIADSANDDPDDIFSIDVYEEDAAGNLYGEGTSTDEGIEFTDVLPNSTLVKKAYVENTGIYDQYVRVIVTISDKAAWQASLDLDDDAFENYDVAQHFIGFNAGDWDLVNSKMIYDDTADTITYVLYKKEILAKDSAAYTVFTGVNVPKTMTREDALLFDGGFTIDVKAQAVQSDNLGSDCYTAFQTVASDGQIENI